MIEDIKVIAYWYKEDPTRIYLIEKGVISWISANYLETSPASPEEIEMFNNGIHSYKIGV